MTHDLDPLDKAATQGEWRRDEQSVEFADLGGTLIYAGEQGYDCLFGMTAQAQADAAFIVALVNAYRSGDLQLRPTSEEVREALAEQLFTLFCFAASNPHSDPATEIRKMLDRFFGGDE